MDFTDKDTQIETVIQNFWSTITTLITGDEHEYVRLRKLIGKLTYPTKESFVKKIKKKIKVNIDKNICS